MQAERFVMFINRVDAMQKYVRQIRASLGADMNMKGVHTLWVYLLSVHPNGLTCAEIADVCSVDRSLVSREIELLRENGIAEYQEVNGRRMYNSTVRLTEKGRALAEEIEHRALGYQRTVDEGITEEELNTFYTVVQKMCDNFKKIVD